MRAEGTATQFVGLTLYIKSVFYIFKCECNLLHFNKYNFNSEHQGFFLFFLTLSLGSCHWMALPCWMIVEAVQCKPNGVMLYMSAKAELKGNFCIPTVFIQERKRASKYDICVSAAVSRKEGRGSW